MDPGCFRMLFGSVNQRLAVVVRKESGSDGTRTRVRHLVEIRS
jgi:hypothetical protein